MPNAEFAYLTIIQYFIDTNPPQSLATTSKSTAAEYAHRRLDGSGSAAHKNKQSHLESDADPQLSTIIRMQNVSYGQVCSITTLGKCSASNYSLL